MCAASCGCSESRKTNARSDVAKTTLPVLPAERACYSEPNTSLTSAVWNGGKGRMFRALLLLSLLFGFSPTALAQPEDAPRASRRTGSTPFWLPRGAFLGTFVRQGAITPQARLQWQVTLF